MKKVLMTSLVAASFAFGANDTQIIEFYGNVLPENLKATVQERKALDSSSGVESVVVNISDGKVTQSDVIFTKGDYVFPDVIDVKKGMSYKASFGEQMLEKNLSKVYKEEDKKYIISLGKDKKNPTKVMFSDPECPYCRAELKEIEKTLKDTNLKIIITPVHDKSSLQKAHLIYKDIAKAKSDSDKVKILRKYFDEKYEVKDGLVSDKEVESIDKLRQKYFATGVRSVPKFVDEAKLLK
ncbi:histidine kinase [Campylobacter pinnipediorum subsp. caledonicus]|uniref:thioredoxin fold domain-containing protein n=1 Tax=Campylobacter pinnipediorum TaxID=1965231 RepID=UPI0009953554|nr:thioredoxin fold domain-containing protein [Campylobacter pinnipediorum]OPA72488.1 histidine kinase [Campylobacter pinnipediorum subsp. caledonicus]